jgi:hypothetical protein
MSNEDDPNKKDTWISNGLLIATFPAFSYAIAYAYEWGADKYYGISAQLIEITLPGTFLAFISLLGIIFLLWQTAEVFNPLWVKLPDPIRRRLKLYNGFLMVFIAYVLIAEEKIGNLKFLWIFFGLSVFFDFIVPALAFRDKRSYADRILQRHNEDLSYDTVLDKIFKHSGASWFLVVLIAIYMLVLSYSLGMGTARRQAEYLLVVGQNDEVVLRQYGDVIVSARINRISKQIAKIYTVRKLSAEKPISFQSEEVGPLTLENISKDAKSNSAESDKSIVKPNIELKRDAAKDRRAP